MVRRRMRRVRHYPVGTGCLVWLGIICLVPPAVFSLYLVVVAVAGAILAHSS